MANPFDQFDAPAAANPFDQFDAAPRSKAQDFATSAVVGPLKGAIGTAGMLGDFREAAYKGAGMLHGWLAQKFGLSEEDAKKSADELIAALRMTPNRFPTSREIRSGVEGVTGPLPEPQTTAGRYAERAGEFIPGALAGPGGVVRNAIRFGVLPGLASEAAGQYTEGTKLEPYARAGAAIATGAGAGILSRPATADRALRAQLPEYVNDGTIAQAEHLIADAGQRGVQLTWPEALSQAAGRPVLTDVQRVLESSPRSRATMQEALGERPQQVQNAAQAEFANVAPASNAPSTIGPAVGQAAEGTINDVRGAINTAAEPFYTRSSTVRLSPQQMAQARALPGFEDARAAVRGDPQLNRYVANLPDDSVGFLNEVKKYLDQQGRNAAAPLAQNPNMQRAAGFGSDAAATRGIATGASTDYATALAVESVARERYLAPLLQGPLGKLADKDITTQRAIDALFPAHPLGGSQQEVSTAVSALAQRNPTAARQLVRAHLEQKLDEAFNSAGRGQEAAQFAGAGFANRVAGSSVIDGQKLENLQGAIQALPNGQQTWDGFQRFLEVMQATGARQPLGSKTAFNAPELQSMSTGSMAGNAVKTGLSPGKWVSVVGDAWNEWQLGHNLDRLAQIVTDPQSGRLLRAISQMPAGSQQAPIMAARIISLGRTAQPSSQSD